MCILLFSARFPPEPVGDGRLRRYRFVMNRPQTPPPRPLPSVTTQLTPEQVRRIELNRLKAKARLREREAAKSESSASSSARNVNNKRPLQVTPAESTSPTAPSKKASSSSKDAPLKRDSRFMGNYFEYDLSKMVNSKGGYLVEDVSASDERTKKLEKERADQRKAQKFDPRMFNPRFSQLYWTGA